MSRNWQILLRLTFRAWQRHFFLYSMTVSCLGIVYFLLILLMALQVSLKTQLAFTTDKPDLFLFDVQPEDRETLKNHFNDFNASVMAMSPMVRGRLLSINDKELLREENKKNPTREEEEQSRFKFRAVNASYKSALGSYEKILEGTELPAFWDRTKTGQELVPISLESRYAKRLKVGIGDRLTFDFQGVQVKTIVVNLRYVYWLSLHPNFFILFPEGVLNDLPQSFLSVLKFSNQDSLNSFINFLQQEFNHISLLMLKQTADLVWRQVTLLLKSFFLISSLFVALGIFLWGSVIYQRMQMERGTIALFHRLGLRSLDIQLLYLGEFLGTFLLIVLITPALGYLAARLLAYEFFDGLLVWPTVEIVGLTIILVLPLAFFTLILVRRFCQIKT